MSEIFIDFFSSFYEDEKKEQSLLDTLLQIGSFCYQLIGYSFQTLF